ncbi:MAG TPA: gamma-glutamyltransferase [Ferruginibacter sp.]|nr:gamma-glutamyltransferase [Ferruginibacter sp.]
MIHKKILLSAALAGLAFISVYSQSNPFNGTGYTIQKKVDAGNGAVVSAHPLASMAGLEMLKRGGNAVDAAIATQLALAVVYPQAGNIGGGGFMVAHFNNGSHITIDYREKAPGKAGRDMFLDKDGNALTDLSQSSHLASGVPGTVAGLFASMKYAKLPFKTLIQPAIDLAENGFAITASQAASFNNNRDEFLQQNTSPVAFVKDGQWKAGDILIQQELANTLKRIRDQGQKGFYEGETARLLAEEMRKGNGIISTGDLASYEAKERPAVVFTYKGYQVISMPLPSSGGLMLQQMMKMIEGRDIASMKFQTTASVQLMTEVERRAFADRAEFLGDADFVKVPVKKLVSEEYLKERMNDYVPGKAGNSKTTGAGSIKESEETTHLSVIDKDGNAVAVTTTLNDSYGSHRVVAGAGFILNNEMDDFSIKPGVPNMYGAIGNDKNAIAPAKRMLSSMTPTLVLKDGNPFLVVGTPGGTTIPTSVFQTLVNILEFGMSPEDAVNKPKFHHQWLPDRIDIEKNFPEDVRKQLEAMGYSIKLREAIGRTEVIRVTYNQSTKQRSIVAVGDKRGDDDARGY